MSKFVEKIKGKVVTFLSQVQPNMKVKIFFLNIVNYIFFVQNCVPYVFIRKKNKIENLFLFFHNETQLARKKRNSRKNPS